MDLFFKDKQEAAEFKVQLLTGMAYGTFPVDQGRTLCDAIDYYVANGGDFEKILQDKFGVSFDAEDINSSPGVDVCTLQESSNGKSL